MQRVDLEKLVAKETGENQETVKKIINSFIETIKKQLLFGVDIKIKGFMNMVLKVQNSREARNPITGVPVEIPKRYKVQIKLSRGFKKKISNKTVY